MGSWCLGDRAAWASARAHVSLGPWHLLTGSAAITEAASKSAGGVGSPHIQASASVRTSADLWGSEEGRCGSPHRCSSASHSAEGADLTIGCNGLPRGSPL